MTGEDLDESEWLRLEVRGLIREFLSVVPRSQPAMTLVFPRLDGTPRAITRAELTAAIDRMRPRQKQVIRLAVEKRRSQEEVCELLNGISLRTLQRDQAEALDLLANCKCGTPQAAVEGFLHGVGSWRLELLILLLCCVHLLPLDSSGSGIEHG